MEITVLWHLNLRQWDGAYSRALRSFCLGELRYTFDRNMIDNAVLSLRIHFVCYPALGILLLLRTSLQAMGRKVILVISSAVFLL